MFTSSVRGGKAFPEETERRSLSGERFKTILNMHRIEKTQNFTADLMSMTILLRKES